MQPIPPRTRLLLLAALLVAAAAGSLALWHFRAAVVQGASEAYRVLVDRERTQDLITSAGAWGPLVFMGIQVLQVLFAPVPGEATGFVGGYLFGAGAGFVYSSVSLALGSWLNFAIGRFLGRRWVRKLIPAARLERLDGIVNHQGLLVVFSLFVFPGFPKDYLCLLLGVTRLPLRVFLPMAAVGRMPGTLMLSLQGAFLFERLYGLFAVIFAVSAGLLLLAYRYRTRLYRWMDNLQNSEGKTH